MKKYIFLILICFYCVQNLKSIPTVSVFVKKQTGSIRHIPQSITEERITNPQIIIWFSGEDGLTIRCNDFYQRNFIVRLSRAQAEGGLGGPFALYLYDLSAWAGLCNRELFLLRRRLGPVVLGPNQQVIYSADFWRFLSHVQEQEAELFRFVCTRPFVWRASADKRDNHLTLGDVAPWLNWLGADVMTKDTAKSYSVIQYLEGLYLIREVIYRQLALEKTPEVNIVFVLPSSGFAEYRYYCPERNTEAFSQDVRAFLVCAPLIRETDIHINIYFYGFEYSCAGTTRPYTRVLADDELVGVL
jgi:hypothetical protein